MAGLVLTCGFSSLNTLPWGSWEGLGSTTGRRDLRWGDQKVDPQVKPGSGPTDVCITDPTFNSSFSICSFC